MAKHTGRFGDLVVAAPWCDVRKSGTKFYDTSPSGAEINAVIAEAPKWGTIFLPAGRVLIDQTIRLVHKPVRVIGSGFLHTTLVKGPTLTGPMIVIADNDYEGLPTTRDWWNYDASLIGMALCDLHLEGDNRQTPGQGIAFRGVNRRFMMRRVWLDNFQGSGLVLCDPDGTLDGDAVNSAIWEASIEQVRISNCGSAASSSPAVMIGRNNAGGTNHNNLKFTGLEIVYPRWKAIEVVNKHASKTIHRLQFHDLWVHGNYGRVGTDPNGEAYMNGQPLIDLAPAGVSTGEIQPIVFQGLKLNEQEGPGVRVGATSIIGHNLHVGSEPGRPAFHFIGARSSVLHGIWGRTTDSLEEAIDIESMASLWETVSVSVIGDRPTAPLVTARTPVDAIRDASARSFVHAKNYADASADASYAEVLVSERLPTAAKWRKAWYIPLHGLVANDDNFATITITTYNSSGGVYSTAITTTKTAASGGTGNWDAKVPVPLILPAEGDMGQAGGTISVQIGKQGAGVAVPAGRFVFELSKYIRYV